jgi:nitroreductase
VILYWAKFNIERRAMVDVLDAIKTRRSIRHYKPDPIPEELLQKVLEAARWAPSWANSQCSRYIVVRDQEKRKQLAGSVRIGNSAMAALTEAPVIIVVCAELGKAGYTDGEKVTGRSDWKISLTNKGDWYMFDSGLAMQNLVLAARAVGLGTVYIGGFNSNDVAEAVKLPRGMEVVAMTPLGYPADEGKASSRKELSELVFNEQYGLK